MDKDTVLKMLNPACLKKRMNGSLLHVEKFGQSLA